jgi:hypothetical protein
MATEVKEDANGPRHQELQLEDYLSRYPDYRVLQMKWKVRSRHRLIPKMFLLLLLLLARQDHGIRVHK